ncbi:MAG TPA: RNA polymerase sigma-70 factor [Candidatus Bacteroides intestinavium]|uniref:RNA polymerase sigma-70 factor n=1 Tax=Candidatus Bacteroides intestinavium TaxID=2838469 RepID=A0A9D2KTS4_9BACE|nr:RNA polymerase sigma-70 factor [Candidatus Bacteroides intestinavium]
MPIRQDTYSPDMDERSFRLFVESYSDDLLYYACYLVSSREEAEEIVSDVFLDVWKRRSHLSEIQDMKAWLLTLVHNRSISCLRQRARVPDSVLLEEVGANALPSDLQTPDEHLISREEIARINRVINQFPPRCRQVFVLAKIEKLPYKEIARMLGISVKTIDNHIASALRQIRAVLEK